MKIMWSGIIARHFFTSEPDRGQRLTSRPNRFTPMEIAPSTHWIGDWVVPMVWEHMYQILIQKTGYFRWQNLLSRLRAVSDNSTDRNVSVTCSICGIHLRVRLFIADLFALSHCHVIQVSNILYQTFPLSFLLPVLFHHITLLLTLSEPTQGSNDTATQWVSSILLQGISCQTSISSSPRTVVLN
jgi:hypothetical protein